jgi:hypothetical protein
LLQELLIFPLESLNKEAQIQGDGEPALTGTPSSEAILSHTLKNVRFLTQYLNTTVHHKNTFKVQFNKPTNPLDLILETKKPKIVYRKKV